MNQFKTAALLGLLSTILITISYWVLGGAGGAMFGIVLAAVMNLGSWYYSDRIASDSKAVDSRARATVIQSVRRLTAKCREVETTRW